MGRRYDRCISRSEEHTSELQSHHDLVCRLLLEKKKPDTHLPSYTGYTENLCCKNSEKTARGFDDFLARRHIDHLRHRHCFFFNDTATTEIYTLSLHDALPI